MPKSYHGRGYFISVLLALAALPTPAYAQAIGPKGDRYELRVGKPKATVYGAAMGVLTDESFTTKEASQDAGVIQTEWRKPGDVTGPGAKDQLKLWVGGGYPIRLNLVLIPIGEDSTRVTISGDFKIENIDATSRIRTSEKREWKILQAIGDEILKALQ